MISRFFLLVLIIVVQIVLVTSQAQTNTVDKVTETEPKKYTGNFTLADGEELPRNEKSKAYEKQIESVLIGDDFSKKKTVKRWRWINTEDKELRDEKFPEWIIDVLEFFEKNRNIMSSIALIIEVALWLLALAILVYVIVNYKDTIRSFVSSTLKSKDSPSLPTTLFGLDLTKEAQQVDVVERAQALWAELKYRDAIALLLSASLIRLIKDFHIKLYDSDTESECCDRIDLSAPKKLSDFMRRLVKIWQKVAYAHQMPNNDEFNVLCEAWSDLFKHSHNHGNEVTDAN